MSDWKSRSMSRIASLTRSNNASPVPPTDSFDDLENLPLPNEINASLQAFLNNLTNPIHKAPFSPERLTNMFQDFYSGMEELVHDCLADETETTNPGEMFSSEELAQQKSKRAIVEAKRLAWREEIEERVCIQMYDKIFELKTSTDEPRDEALMSKIIAMNLIGVSLEQLGVGLSESEWRDMQPTVTWIGEELQSLNNASIPRAKIDILVACHKQIVAEVQNTKIADDLAVAIDQSDETTSTRADIKSSEERKHLGADAILPIFIFSIIKSNPAKLVSHFQYIQRFRTANLLTGEAAYCLTNLEAAIGFLETFDDGSNGDMDPLHTTMTDSHLKTPSSAVPLSASLRAGERARALSSAAQDVYDFADERMKTLGSQFGSQLNALVRGVGQTQNLEDVRSLMGVPTFGGATTSEHQMTGTISQGTEPFGSASSNLRRDLRSSSPAKNSSSNAAGQGARAGGSFGRLTGLGMIRNLSNSFSTARSNEISRPGTRELQTLSNEAKSGASDSRARTVSSASGSSFAPSIPTRQRKFLDMDAEDLTLRDVKELLAEYKKLCEQVT